MPPAQQEPLQYPETEPCGAYGVPYGTSVGSATPGWLMPTSEIHYADYEDSTIFRGDDGDGDSKGGGAEFLHLTASKHLCESSQLVAIPVQGRRPSHPGDEHPGDKTGGLSLERLTSQ